MRCEICGERHDPRRCSGHVDDGKREAYAVGGRAARLAAPQGPPRQCRNRPVRFSTVCTMHGGEAEQVKAAAARRRTLHEALKASDRRHPVEILADALHTVDVVAQQALELLAEGDPVTPELLQTVLDTARQAAPMARLVLDSGGADWSAAEAARRQGEAMGQVVVEALRLLGLDHDVPDVRAAMRAAIAKVAFGDRVPAREFVARRRAKAARPLELEAEVLGED